MIFQYDPYALLALTAAVISALVAAFIWSRRPGRAVKPFVVLMLAVSVWSFYSGLEILSAVLRTKHFFASMTYFGITVVPAAWLVFVLEYTGRDRFITRRNLILLAIHPIVTIPIVLTNAQHHLFWSSVNLDSTLGYVTYEFGAAFWIHSIYSYALLLVGAVMLISAFVRSPQLYRGQITLLMIGQFIPWVANALFITGRSPLPEYVDLTPLAFTITGIVTGWSLYRFRLMDLAPVAHYAVFESMVDAVFVIDIKQRIVDANQSALELLRLPATDVIGKPAPEVFARQRDLIERFQDVHAADEEIRLVTGGEERFFQMRLSPLLDRGGALSGRSILLHDITQLKRTNRELEQARQKADDATRLKSEFLATVSHELRTPLNAVLGYTELMLAGIMGELTDATRQPIMRIDENSRYLLDLIGNILDLSKIEAGKVEITPSEIDVPTLVNMWHRRMVVLADDKGIELQTHVEPGFPQTIYADERSLTQIAINLLANAVKFTEQGRVKLTVCSDGDDHFILEVQDTGVGMTEQEQAYVFDEFRQVDNSHQRQHAGTGLGLTIVSRLTAMMAGEISVQSAVGTGSTFRVRLPLHKLDPAVPNPA